jgi:hypothetical protein
VTKHFVSEPITICHGEASSHPEASKGEVNEPQLPTAFTWRNQVLEVKTLLGKRRSTKEDRGDVYLKRHWFEFETGDGRIATVYFDRAAKRGEARWWLYAIED